MWTAVGNKGENRANLFLDGGADGIRTHYLLTASQTLSRLSYSPTRFKNITKQLGKHKLRDQARPF